MRTALVCRGGATALQPRPARAAKPGAVRVHLWSDISCPWCYVGKKRLEKAVRQVQQSSGVEVEVKWNPFIMDPQMDPQGEEYMAYNMRRWGSDSWTDSLRRSGAPDGAMFSNWKTWPNTLKAHMLVALADEEGLGDDAKDLLFQRTYEEGGNVSLLHELEAIAEELALDMDRVSSALAGRDGGELQRRVLECDAAAKQQLRIKGVPHFIIAAGPNNRHKYALSGAQQPEQLLGAILQTAAEAAASAAEQGRVTPDLVMVGSQELAMV